MHKSTHPCYTPACQEKKNRGAETSCSDRGAGPFKHVFPSEHSGRSSCMADIVLLSSLCLYFLPSRLLCCCVYPLVWQQADTVVILWTIFMEALPSTSQNQPVIHNPRWHHQNPFCEQRMGRRVQVCVTVCVCPSLLSLPLLFFSLLTERVPALCVFWLTTVKERRLFSTYPETLPCQDWDENPFFSAKSSQPGVSQQITHTYTAAAVGGRVIPGYKSHLDMQGSVANRAGQRHSKLSCCIRSQEQQGAPKRPRVIMHYINMLNQVKFSEAQEESLEMSSVAIAPLHLLHYGCCEYKTHAKLQYILFICTRIHLYVYKPTIQDVNMCRVWINNMKKMLSVEPITAVVLTNPSGFLTCGPFDILTSKLWFLRQTECTISLTTCFVLGCCHI